MIQLLLEHESDVASKALVQWKGEGTSINIIATKLLDN